MKRTYIAFLLAVSLTTIAQAQSAAPSPIVPVTADNFKRAESDLYFSTDFKQGGFSKIQHHREPMAIDKQTVVRANRDTLYSSGVFDLDDGPVTITLPDAGKRFMSLQMVSEDHYTQTYYGTQPRTFTRQGVGTRYVMIGIRTLVNPADAKDVQQVHVLQDAIRSSQKSPGKFEVPNWDPASQKRVRDALLLLNATLPDSKRMFGMKDQVDPVRHLVGTASAWGGNPEKDAKYLNVTPAGNDGTTVHKLTVKDVPVDGFWSMSVYNADGYFQMNPYNAYTLNNITAVKAADGSFTAQFGACDGKIPNCLPIVKGWNYMVRLYRPRAETLNGKWTFPEAQPAAK